MPFISRPAKRRRRVWRATALVLWVAAVPTGAALAEAALPRLAAILGWGSERRAILALPGGQSWAVAGDEIGWDRVGAVRILAIDADSVRIERAGTQYVLTLDNAAADPDPVPQPAFPPANVLFPGETRGVAVYAQRPAPD